MPRTARPDGLDELLEKQLSVASRDQLLAVGMNDRAVQYRVRPGGPWQTVLPGVYLATSGVPSLPQKEMAALLYAGPGSLSTGFARIHRTARMPGRSASSGPVRLVLIPRAVADTARQFADLRDVRAVVADAVQLGRCTISELATELRNGPTRGSAKFRSVLAEVTGGIRSTAEGDLRDLIIAARLPLPLFNPSLYTGDVFLGRPDAWWPEAGVTAEADSREWHLSPADWDRTRRRHQLMAAAGIIPLHFSPREIRREPAMVGQRIRDTLTSGLARPPLPIRTIPA